MNIEATDLSHFPHLGNFDAFLRSLPLSPEVLNAAYGIVLHGDHTLKVQRYLLRAAQKYIPRVAKSHREDYADYLRWFDKHQKPRARIWKLTATVRERDWLFVRTPYRVTWRLYGIEQLVEEIQRPRWAAAISCLGTCEAYSTKIWNDTRREIDDSLGERAARAVEAYHTAKILRILARPV